MATLDEVGVIRFAPKLAKKLIADWNTVESSLQSFGISCEHNKDDKLFMGEQTTIVRVFASSSTEMASVGKALTLFKLLSTTYLALPEAIQVALHRKPCVIIKTGINNGGFSKKYNIDKETFGKRHRDFAKHVQKIADLTCTNIYLSGNSLAVTGRSALGSSICWVYDGEEDCERGVCSECGSWVLGLQDGEAKGKIQDGGSKEKIQDVQDGGEKGQSVGAQLQYKS